ncbi:hypothetical protein DFH09DRAFT_1086366 [Mycena vulgaris]|nr:hypothetical protein DFH09DRAFT_1086366 [Mycena vulgaris]
MVSKAVSDFPDVKWSGAPLSEKRTGGAKHSTSVSSPSDLRLRYSTPTRSTLLQAALAAVIPLTPPGTPRRHHNDERRALRDLRANVELSPRRRRVPNPPNCEARTAGNENVPPHSAQSIVQKRRWERERRERGALTPPPRNAARSRTQQARRRNKESDRQMQMDIDGPRDLRPARTSSTIEVYSQELTPLDYHAFGDIVWLVPLGSPENFGLCHHACVHVSGLPTNINKDDSTFEIHAEQYLSATKSPENLFPVTFLGQALTAPKAEEIPAKLANIGTPLKFTGFFGGQETDIKHNISGVKLAHKTANPYFDAQLRRNHLCRPNLGRGDGTCSHVFGTESANRNANRLRLEESEDKGEGTSTGRHSKRH